MKEAVPQCSLHVENHRELEAHIEAATVLEWRKVVQAWEADRSKPNPYMAETTCTSLSQDAIRLRLADAEAAALAAGTLDQLHDEMTPSMYVASGLDLEHQQYQLAETLASLGQHATDRQRLLVVTRANTLRVKITNYYDVQKLYCPAAFMLVSKANGSGPSSSTNATEAVSRLNLGLPSSFKTLTGCSKELRELEWQLRYAQALDALNAIRAGLHLRVSVFHHKDRFDRGQHALTRSMGSLSRVQSQIDGATHRYRVARAALLVLAQFLSKDNLQEIIHTHERKESLALQHVAAMQAEFGILTKELQARYHEVPLVPVIQRLHSQILELSSALQWGGPIQSPYQVAAEHGMAARGAQSQRHSHFQCTQIPDVESRVVQTDSRRTLSKGIQVRCTQNGETQTEHLPKSDKSVQLRWTRTGQAQTEAQPTSDKSVQLRSKRTGQAQAESSPPSNIVQTQQTQTEPPQASTRLEAESGREALSSSVPAQEALTPMTPTRMASTSASTTSFTFRMTASPSRSIMRSGRPNSLQRPRETISRGTSIERVARAPDAGMRKRGRSASNSPEGDTHSKRRKPSEDSGDLDDPFEDTQPETRPLTSADVKDLTAKQINHLLAALRKVGVKFPNTKSPKVETRRRWLFDALAGPITITIFEALTSPETAIVKK
ncbi:hypothetical protein EYR38_004912 [Pleurotus pulmonarius]|nr:hypothetical protein EYR38_004912 [Pleurotus pulmonarius]